MSNNYHMRNNNKHGNDWGTRLRRVLKEQNISLRKAARIAGVSASVIDSWSAGSTPGNLLAVKRLTDELKISFCWLLTGDAENTSQSLPMSQLFDEQPYFEGYARIRIEKLTPKKG